MKKIISILGIMLLMTGCGCSAIEDMSNTPTKKVEAYLNSYQSLDDNVLNDLDNVLDETYIFNDEQRNRYREVVKNGYQELSYEIKEETIDGDTATVTTEIEVVDHSTVISNADTYLREHADEFNDEEGNYDMNLFTNYRLDMLEKNKEKVKYTIDFKLRKKDGEWILDDLSENDLNKINGTYVH